MAPLPTATLSLCQVENSTLAQQLYGAQVLKFLPQTDQHQTEAEYNERFGPDVTGRLKIDGVENFKKINGELSELSAKFLDCQRRVDNDRIIIDHRTTMSSDFGWG
ncbi:hypothetical protein MAN_10587, partial [Metarhizium hybridum]